MDLVVAMGRAGLSRAGSVHLPTSLARGQGSSSARPKSSCAHKPSPWARGFFLFFKKKKLNFFFFFYFFLKNFHKLGSWLVNLGSWARPTSRSRARRLVRWTYGWVLLGLVKLRALRADFRAICGRTNEPFGLFATTKWTFKQK